MQINKTTEDLCIEHKDSIDIELFETEIKTLVYDYIEIKDNEKKIADDKQILAKV